MRFIHTPRDRVLLILAAMGTSAWFAYRYKGTYYRIFYSHDGDPAGIGQEWASKIPDDPALLKAYILETIPIISTAFSKKHGSVTEDNSWMVPATFTRWTYLIDFDNNVFTVNGTVHFRLDNMPPRQRDPQGESDFTLYFDDELPIPVEYITTASYWDPPHFDIDQAQKLYSGFYPVATSLVEWGAPTWDALSVAQHLSACLIRTHVADHTEELALVAFRHVQHALGMFTWQIACMAASSNITCPPAGAAPLKDTLYARASLDEEPRYFPAEPIAFYVASRGFRNRFFRFRGCVVTLVVRLDESVYMMHEVGRLADRLSSREGGGVGIAISSWQMVAVAVDGSSVRHSPVLDLHDREEELKDGMLLLMHLLRPTAPGLLPKSPWCKSTPSYGVSVVSPVLPEEIIQRIIHFADSETYPTLPLVSRHFRSICLSQPRVGHFTLLAKQPGSNAIFKVSSTTSSTPALATLTRVTAINYSDLERGEPRLWKYDPKSAIRIGSVLQPGLAGTFQHHQTGRGSLEGMQQRTSQVQGPRCLMWSDIIAGNLPTMRIQLIMGLWDMLVVGSERARKLEERLNAPPDANYIGGPPYIGEEIQWEAVEDESRS